MNKLIWRSALCVSVLAMAAGGIACGGTTGSGTVETPSAAQAGTTTAAVAATAHGQVKLMGEALGEVGLRADQRTQLEQLATTAEARHLAVRGARKDLMLSIADQIEKGSIDRTALQPKIDATTTAFKAARPADRADFEKIHAILDATQRSEFVDALKTKAQAKFAGGGHGHKGGFMGGHGGHLAKLAEDLQLTSAQQDQIKAIMKDERKEHDGARPFMRGKEHMDAVMTAFKNDRFVMDEVAPTKNVDDVARPMEGHMIDFAEKVMPILTPAQQKLAATKLRERANDTNAAEEGPMGPAPF